MESQRSRMVWVLVGTPALLLALAVGLRLLAGPVADADLAPPVTPPPSADAAIAAEIGRSPPQSPVTRRPAFVSEMEWLVLQELAQHNSDPARELTRLVNNLRFNKELERWQVLAGPDDATARHAVAEQLLAELPERVRQQEYGVTEAQRLQRTLLEDLIADPAARRAREAAEAARLPTLLQPVP